MNDLRPQPTARPSVDLLSRLRMAESKRSELVFNSRVRDIISGTASGVAKVDLGVIYEMVSSWLTS